MNMKRSEFVLGALSVAFVGCTKDGIGEEAKNTKEKVEMKKPLVVYLELLQIVDERGCTAPFVYSRSSSS